MTASHYTTIFLDIGGVILTNGWDHKLREKAAEVFGIDFVEMNKRHGITFDTYEIGKISLNGSLSIGLSFTQNVTFPARILKNSCLMHANLILKC